MIKLICIQCVEKYYTADTTTPYLKCHNVLILEFDNEQKTTAEYKRLNENLRSRYEREKDELIDRINILQEQIDSSEIKLNARNAGRKPYSNEKVIDKIYSLYISGKSLQRVASELNSLVIKTNRNKDWSKS
ncbi:MAG: recombinase family protein [Solirubrobacterales bacterium]